MYKTHLIITALLAYLLSAYTPSPWDTERLVQEFIADAHHFQVPVNLDMVQVRLVSPIVHPGDGSALTGHFGLSSWVKDAQGNYMLRIVQLNSSHPYTREQFKVLVYHELAHASYDLDHTDKGIMRGHLLSPQDIVNEGGLPRLIDEMFTQIRIKLHSGGKK